MFPDADSLLFTTTCTLVLILISLFFTILLIRSKPSTMNRRPEKGTNETPLETKTVETKEAPEIPKIPETSKRLKAKPPVKGCLHYLGYLEKLSTSSFPYECLACPKLGECIGENKKKQERIVGDMSEYRIATRIEATIEKANNAPWKHWRGKMSKPFQETRFQSCMNF